MLFVGRVEVGNGTGLGWVVWYHTTPAPVNTAPVPGTGETRPVRTTDPDGTWQEVEPRSRYLDTCVLSRVRGC